VSYILFLLPNAVSDYLSEVKELSSQESLIVLVRILKGSHNKDLLSNQFHKLSGYGKGNKKIPTHNQRLLTQHTLFVGRQLTDAQGRNLVIRLLLDGYLETVDKKTPTSMMPAYKITVTHI